MRGKYSLGGIEMKKTTQVKLTRAELIGIIEREYEVKFESTSLSSTGFKGWFANE